MQTINKEQLDQELKELQKQFESQKDQAERARNFLNNIAADINATAGAMQQVQKLLELLETPDGN